MDARNRWGTVRLPTLIICAGLLVFSSIGCMVSPPVSTRQIVRQRALLDFSGLLPSQQMESLKVVWSLPRDWEVLPLKKGAIFTHQQCRSPSGATGVGVAYVRLPIPLPTSTIAWIAQREYLKRNSEQKEGKLIARWRDSAGREWFEAENEKYHGTGYVMARGNEAWIVYSGWRMVMPPEPDEISISQRSAVTIIPFVN